MTGVRMYFVHKRSSCSHCKCDVTAFNRHENIPTGKIQISHRVFGQPHNTVLRNMQPSIMKLGFADCAYARWRSMYELCCNAAFIKKHGEIIAKQYFEQSQTDEHKYSWTKGAKKDDGTELKITTFQGIQDNCDVDEAWKKQYKLACFVNHGSPQGTFKRLSLMDEQSLIVVGQSDYGITTPAEHSAISLQWITSMFLSVFPCLDALAHAIAFSTL